MITKDQVITVLKTVKDPEIMYNVYDLGLVYGVEIEDSKVNIKMTMTTPFCPYTPALLKEVEESVKRDVSGVTGVSIEVVWDPPWSLDKVAPEIRADLGM